MANTPLSYSKIKASMADSGFPVSAGAGWTATDEANYLQFGAGVAYGKEPFRPVQLHYGLAYASEMPASVTTEVNGDADKTYSATLSADKSSGAHPLAIVFTVNETGGQNATSFAWDFGDGTTATTTTPTTNHSYAAAGTFIAKVTPTLADGHVTPQKSAGQITVS